jgi:hypothetical protein
MIEPTYLPGFECLLPAPAKVFSSWLIDRRERSQPSARLVDIALLPATPLTLREKLN